MNAYPATGVLRLGTRGSALALVQTRRVAERLRQVAPGVRTAEIVLRTRGDADALTPLPAIGGKGVFTETLERALLEGEIDLAVHSLKDLPVEPTADLVVGAVCLREDPRDALVSADGRGLLELPAGAVVGSSSTRRAAQLRRIRPDLRTSPIRGNVETRVAKVEDGQYAATLLACAGLVRLGLAAKATEVLSTDAFLPAPGQGALAVQCRADDFGVRELVTRLDEREARAATEAERAFLAGLGGGCSLPVAALAHLDIDDSLVVEGRVLAPDGSREIHVSARGRPGEARLLGAMLANDALRRGAAELLG